jgi:hypothetical protein
MDAKLSTRRLLAGLTVTFLLTGCAAGATSSPRATTAATASGAVATSTLTPTQNPPSTSSPEPSTPLGPPAAPTGATYHDNQTLAQVPVTVAWHQASPDGVSIWVYGVIECLASRDGADCVTATTKIPASALLLIGKFPAAAGTTTWTWTGTNIAGALGVYNSVAYHAIILIAVNEAGRSSFVVAGTSKRCSTCTY